MEPFGTTIGALRAALKGDQEMVKIMLEMIEAADCQAQARHERSFKI